MSGFHAQAFLNSRPGDAPVRRGAARRKAQVLAAAAFASLLIGAGPAGAADALYGLVVGIDDYIGTVNDLQGAVNDATGIAASLKQAGAREVTLLTDAQATRATIEADWFDYVKRAQPGDTIVFSYAGHGGQEPQPPGWDEPNGKSDNFLLAGYQSSGPGQHERIVDWEMYQWLKAADDKGINVVLVADSCHSGTMYRSAGSKTIRYRTGKFEDPELAGDLGKLPDPALGTTAPKDFKSVTFIAATQDNMLTPELTIDGVAHGALSWAFAKAVGGAADRDGDGHLSQQELLAYLVPTVQAQAENQQIPGILPLRPETTPIMRSMPGETPTATADPVAEDQSDETVHLFVRGGAPADLPKVDGVEVTDDESAADLIWDPSVGTVDHRIGGRVAEDIHGHDIAAVLSKWSALAFLKAHTGDDPVSLSTPTGNQTYTRGDMVELDMDGAQLPYLTLFNLPPNGRVEFFMPGDEKEVNTDWRGQHLSEKFRVDQPPFGAEHMIAILTAEPALALHEALKSMPNADAAAGLAATLRSVLGNTPFQAGIVGIYTQGETP